MAYLYEILQLIHYLQESKWRRKTAPHLLGGPKGLRRETRGFLSPLQNMITRDLGKAGKQQQRDAWDHKRSDSLNIVSIYRR